MLSAKTFYYQIPEIHFSSPVFVDINECKTVSDLKNKIASDLQIKENKLTIRDKPKEAQLDKITEYSTFNLSFLNVSTEFDIFYNGELIHFKNCDKLSFYQIVSSFYKKGIYFSKEIIEKNLTLSIAGKELPRKIEFPLLAAPKDARTAYLNVNCETVVLKYDNKSFIFRENEPFFNACDFIREVYQECSSVVIRNERDIKINDADKLKTAVRYKVNVEFKMKFSPFSSGANILQKMDSLSTVSDAKMQLASSLSVYTRRVRWETITLYDNQKRKIYANKVLMTVQNLNDVFYYEINDSRNKEISKPPEETTFLSTSQIENDLNQSIIKEQKEKSSFASSFSSKKETKTKTKNDIKPKNSKINVFEEEEEETSTIGQLNFGSDNFIEEEEKNEAHLASVNSEQDQFNELFIEEEEEEEFIE